MRNAISADNRAISRWLIACAAMVFLIVVVGGITRLTRSGLSIVEWKPIAGTLPPIGEAEWNAEFAKYRETPEYKLVNKGMQLAEFKNIFWWEYIHRVIARLIGVVFLFPFLYFLIRRKIHGRLGIKLAFIFLLGGLQGFVGWYMVKSGLVKDPHVSHLRLMTHLMLAVLLYTLLLSTAWQLRLGARNDQKNKGGWITVIAAFILLASGALVAGLKAGKMYNTFPLMNGAYFPPGVEWLSPSWTNLYENPAIVQFLHRNLAYLFGMIVIVQVYQRRSEIAAAGIRHPLSLLVIVYALQVLLGVLTLLNAVPVSLGAIHQANALLLYSAALYAFTRDRYLAA